MINICDKYAVLGDRYNYILVRNTKKKNSDDSQVVEGYCQTMQHIFDLIYRIETRSWINKHDAELKEANTAFEEIWEDIQAWSGTACQNCKRYEK